MYKNFMAYQLALELYKDCARVKAPSHITDQLRRASLSVVLNISEGAEKKSIKDRHRFYEYSMTSLRETQTLVDVLDLGELINKADRLAGMLYRLVQNCE